MSDQSDETDRIVVGVGAASHVPCARPCSWSAAGVPGASQGRWGRCRDPWPGTALWLPAEQITPSTGEFMGNLPQAFSHVGVIAGGVDLARARAGAQG